MRRYTLPSFGRHHLELIEVDEPTPQAHEVLLEVRAMSLNYRDLAVIDGSYNKRLPLPLTPVSDAAGVIRAVGSEVQSLRVGDEVMTHFVAGWHDGPFLSDYLANTLGAPGPGVAAELVALDENAVIAKPPGWDFAASSTLPIAGLTAWSALVTEAHIKPGDRVLTLGTGGVSSFAIAIANALGAEVFVTSSSDHKLALAKALGADHGINYLAQPEWDKAVWELSGRQGVDLVIETVGAATLSRSLRTVRAGGMIALMGSLSGLQAEVGLAPLIMRRLRVVGVVVDSRARFAEFIAFLGCHRFRPQIGARFAFEDLPLALEALAAGVHVGKIVVER